MKKYFVLLLTLTVLCAVATSCTSNLPKRFDRFVSSVENNYSSYSEDDWSAANEKFESLVDEYKENRSSFNSDDKHTINSAIVRYTKVVAKSGFESVVDAYNDFRSQLPMLIEDAKSVLQEFGSAFDFDNNE